MKRILRRVLSVALSFALLFSSVSIGFVSAANEESRGFRAWLEQLFATQAMTEQDAHDFVAVIAAAILGSGPYPAMTFNPANQTYTFNASSLSFGQVLGLFERVVLADAALSGSIDGVPNFPGYNVAARLATAHGITVTNAPARAIAAIRASVQQGFDPRLLANYSTVPTGSGWTSDFNFEPAPAEWAALQAAGGPLRREEPGRPSYLHAAAGYLCLSQHVKRAVSNDELRVRPGSHHGLYTEKTSF